MAQNMYAMVEHHVNLPWVTVWCGLSVLGIIISMYFEKVADWVTLMVCLFCYTAYQHFSGHITPN